jgi:hypothetical protein
MEMCDSTTDYGMYRLTVGTETNLSERLDEEPEE